MDHAAPLPEHHREKVELSCRNMPSTMRVKLVLDIAHREKEMSHRIFI